MDFCYCLSCDITDIVLPKVIVVVGLGELLSQRISMPFSRPLGESDDFFNLPKEKIKTLIKVYQLVFNKNAGHQTRWWSMIIFHTALVLYHASMINKT